FVPREEFDRIVTPEIVLQIVEGLGCYSDRNDTEKNMIAQDIYYGTPDETHPPCRKLLTALVLEGREVERIDEFIKEKLSDDCLPLTYDSESHAGALRCRIHGDSHTALNAPTNPNQIQFFIEFTEHCQRIMPPFITWEEGTLHNHYIMEEGGHLPFVFGDSVQTREGGFGTVWKVTIKPGDGYFGCYWSGIEPGVFALKQLKQDAQRGPENTSVEFQHELGMLLFSQRRAQSQTKKMQQVKDIEIKSHMLQVLASFEIPDSKAKDKMEYFMLFPWADGHLGDFWAKPELKDSPRPVNHRGWMIYQFAGLAKALQCVHNSKQTNPGDPSTMHFGRHGDIKPTNILFFEHRDGHSICGIKMSFALADFGLGRLHKQQSVSKDDPDKHAKTATYQAPEVDVKGGTLSPKSDVFSLGCVFLEYITWLLLASPTSDPLDEFSNARLEKNIHGFDADAFYSIDQDTPTSATLKNSVKDWINDKLRPHPDCVEIIDETLKLIENRMLHSVPKKRIDSHSLVTELERIIGKLKHEEQGDYVTRHW
ncbi:kinase-like domain-containing protein, partial [Cladorrhinum sp. PSN259]